MNSSSDSAAPAHTSTGGWLPAGGPSATDNEAGDPSAASHPTPALRKVSSQPPDMTRQTCKTGRFLGKNGYVRSMIAISIMVKYIGGCMMKEKETTRVASNRFLNIRTKTLISSRCVRLPVMVVRILS